MEQSMKEEFTKELLNERFNALREKFKALEKQDTVMLNGENRQLYREYANPSEALALLKQTVPDTLEWLQQQSSAPLWELSADNRQQYYDLAMEYETDGTLESPRWDEIILICQFFDIYENTQDNDFIREKVGEINLPSFQMQNNWSVESYTKSIEHLLPFSYRAVRSSYRFDTNAAIRYAEMYAENPNEWTNDGQYQVFSNDCTNFASQILEAWGISQDVSDNENYWRWHKIVDGTWWWKNHKHSISFIRARTFAKYMGVKYTTDNHYDFSSNIQAWDFIGYDQNNDWQIDHMAFVTNKDWFPANWWGKTYYNYRVAQHTNNYLRWVDDDRNWWEKLEDKWYTYARVRR